MICVKKKIDDIKGVPLESKLLCLKLPFQV